MDRPDVKPSETSELSPLDIPGRAGHEPGIHFITENEARWDSGFGSASGPGTTGAETYPP